MWLKYNRAGLQEAKKDNIFLAKIKAQILQHSKHTLAYKMSLLMSHLTVKETSGEKQKKPMVECLY